MTAHVLEDAADRTTALTDFRSNLVVVAGAGTGKTSLLVGRLAFALVRMHMETHEVLALTFTDNAAAEMRSRLIRLLRAAETWLDGGEVADASDRHTLEDLGFGHEDRSRIRDVLAQADSLPLSTFHSFCSRLLSQHARLLGLPPEQSMGDQEGSRARYDAAFLEYLAAQPIDDIPEALRRFEPKALHDFGWELRSLPLDAVSRCTEVPAPNLTEVELRAAIEEVRGFRQEPLLEDPYPKVLADVETGLSALADGDYDAVSSLLLEKLTRLPWRKRTDVDTAKRIKQRTNELLGFLRPYSDADPAAIRSSIEFVRPFLTNFQTEAMARGEFTYDDIILQARQQLMRSPALRRAAGGRLKAVLVDEFQDTDPLLYDILFMLCGEAVEGQVETPLEVPLRTATLFIVGDPKQSIYRFRSADLAAFDLASKRVCAAGGRRLSLRTNFRCAEPIVEFVNHTCRSLLAEDEPYQLEYEAILPHVRNESATVEWLEVEGTDGASAGQRRELEGRATVDAIQRFRDAGIPYSGIAVLLRAATDTNWLMRPLRQRRIPYAMEGSRRFYQRHEVIVATALLGAIARPQDPVPVLGVLRSAFSAATDRAIFEHVKNHGRHALDYRRATASDGPVGKTLGWLRELREVARSMPVDRAVEHVLTLDAWTLTEGAGYEGAQRLANIERMLQRTLDARPLDLAAAADFAEQRTAREIEDEESPLFDPDFDAVRVLTIHASKGLEYDAVIVPDLARSVSGAERDGNEAKIQRAFLGDGREIVGARLGGLRNSASWILRGENKRHSEAEARRLFYVAATRAKRQLTFLCCQSSKQSRSIQSSLQGQAESTRPFPASTMEGCHEPTTPAVTEPDPHADVVAETLAAWRAHEEAVRRFAPAEPEPQRAIADMPPPTSGGITATHSLDYDPAELGSAIHRYLAIVDLQRDALDEELADAVVENDDYRMDLFAMATAFHGSALANRMRSAAAVHREVPIAFVDAHGECQSRIVDVLLVEGADDEAPRHTIVDHKSDRVATGEHAAIASHYTEQLARYAEGVMIALELGERPECVVHFLRDGHLETVLSD